MSFEGISNAYKEVYIWIVRYGRLPHSHELQEIGVDARQLNTAVEWLQHLGLIGFSDPDHFNVIPPDLAEAEILIPMERRIRDMTLDIKSAHNCFEELRVAYFNAQKDKDREYERTIDKIVGIDALQKVLQGLTQKTQNDVIINQPWHQKDSSNPQSQLLSTLVVNSHVCVRCLMPHGAFTGLAGQRRFKYLSEFNIEFRTVPEVADFLVVFDEEVVVLITTEGNTVTGTVIREASVVGYLRRTCERQWILGRTHFGDHHKEEMSEEIKILILRLLAAGLKDEAIAKRVNLSVRTCRRHIAEIMEMMGATSRFQAGAI